MNKILKKIVDPKVYDILRSKNQLGYAVGCQIESFGGVQCMSVIVLSQEHKHKYSEVHNKIDEFIETIVRPAINNLTEEEFEKNKESRIKDLQQDVLSLSQEVSENWEEIEFEYYTFDKYEQFVETTKALTLAEFKEFVDSFLNPEKCRKLCLQVIGNEDSTNQDDHDLIVRILEDEYPNHVVIKNIEEFQKNLHLYPTLEKFE